MCNNTDFHWCTAAVTALAKFGAHCEELMPSILVLLKRYEEIVLNKVPPYVNSCQLRFATVYTRTQQSFSKS